MAESDQKPVNPAEKKWTAWSVIVEGNGSWSCQRTNVDDQKETERRPVPPPTFGEAELEEIVRFGATGIVQPKELAHLCHERRRRDVAFRMCDALNGRK